MNLVDAQQARRVLDRIVGYKISPILWSKIKRGLSAGRVQSVALRIICDREKEIDEYISQEYWSLIANILVPGAKKTLEAHFAGDKNGKIELHSQKEVDALVEKLQKEKFEVLSVKNGERRKKPPLPFTTSTLQQEASKRLNMSTQKTMRLAQELYEGVTLKGKGSVGLITYLRTDSTRISEEADASCREYIAQQYGEQFVGDKTAVKSSKTGKIQDAHEAIRPTNIRYTPAELKDSLSRDQFRLYQLIWKRFTASRMSNARYETTSVKIDAGNHRFTVAASKLAYDGFMSVYRDDEDEKQESNTLVKDITKDTQLKLSEFEPKQHFTQPPAHYTEASLVRALEELGIGRPSTYAPTITTILARRYVVKEDKNLYVSELGEVVNNMMKDAFPSIVDVNFTANLETLLDKVEEGVIDWKTVVSNFYPDLDEAVNKAEKELAEIKIADEESDEICDVCGRRMVIKYGPHGKFLACPGFPECRNTKPYFEKIGVACPKCGKDIVVRKTKKGRKYYGCENNPDCDFMVWQRPSNEKCERCGSIMLIKGNKLVCANESCGFVKNRVEQESK